MHIGDIAPMLSMGPVDENLLFSEAPTEGMLATKEADIGSARFPTWRPGAPTVVGTIFGPANSATVPSLGDDANPPAANPTQAMSTGLPAGPITFLSPLPSMVRPAAGRTVATAPSFWCQFNNWVSDHPGLAALGAVGVFFLLKGKSK